MDVAQWMKRDLVTIGPQDDLLKADRLMTVYQIRHLPVLDEQGALVGILSDRDMRDQTLPDGLGAAYPSSQHHLRHIKVEAIMTKKVHTLEPSAPIERAVWLMKTKRINSLPIVENGKLVGLLTSTTLLTFFGEYMGARPGMVRLRLALDEHASQMPLLVDILHQVAAHYTQLSVRENPHNDHMWAVVILPQDEAPRVQEALAESGLAVESVTQMLADVRS